jgi:hypothetical protein
MPREHAEGTWANQIIGQIPFEEVSEWQQFAAAATRASTLVTLPDLRVFKRWAPRIRRFSFVLSPLNEAATDRDA